MDISQYKTLIADLSRRVPLSREVALEAGISPRRPFPNLKE